MMMEVVMTMNQMMMMKLMIVLWSLSMLQQTTVTIDNIDSEDSISIAGGKTCSSAGRSSNRSSTTRLLFLLWQLPLKEKHELKAQEEQIRQQKGVLELQSQIATHTARVTVLKYRGSDVHTN